MNRKEIYSLMVGALLSVALGTLRAAAKEDESKPAARPEPAPAEIAEWIGQLDDNRYLVREQATRHLLAAGARALDPLLTAANGDRPEPADRAVWIMRRLGRSSDNEQSIAALERMAQLRGRPHVVARAELDLTEAYQKRLVALGAEIVMEPAQFDIANIVPLFHLRLGEKWQGTTTDLQCLAQMRSQQHFRLEGPAIDNTVAKIFEGKEGLAFVQFLDARVTPAAVDSLKERQPNAIVYVRGEALLGVQAANHGAGVLVTSVEPGTAAAAAGIMKGDIIASINSHSLPDFDRLTARIAQHRAGETAEVEIIRGEQRKKLSVTFGSWAGRE